MRSKAKIVRRRNFQPTLKQQGIVQNEPRKWKVLQSHKSSQPTAGSTLPPLSRIAGQQDVGKVQRVFCLDTTKRDKNENEFGRIPYSWQVGILINTSYQHSFWNITWCHMSSNKNANALWQKLHTQTLWKEETRGGWTWKDTPWGCANRQSLDSPWLPPWQSW